MQRLGEDKMLFKNEIDYNADFGDGEEKIIIHTQVLW